MPDQSANLTALRTDGHKVRVHFGAFVGSVVFTATVDSTPADQALNLTVTAVSGSASDVKRGFQVRVYRADGTTLKGVTNIRVIGTISATSLPIRELGQADIAIAAGDVLKVYNVPYLGDKLPSDDITFSPDGLTYSTEGSAIAPNCRSGGHRIGMVDTGQTYRSEVMAGIGSGNLDPDSAAPGTHLWVLLTATLAFAPGSAATDANPTLRANVGYGLAQHTYTDSSNSASWYQYVCFQVYDTDNPPIRVLGATIDGLEESGWSAEFETYAYSTLSELPDGTLGALFVRETINGVDTSYGASIAGLSHVKCLGFLTHDESDLQSSIRRLRLRLQSPWQRQAGLPGFSKVMTRAVSADWTTIEGMTVKLAIFHLLHYYSFFSEMFDVVIDSAFLDKAYAQFFLQKLTADLQVKELAAGVDARVTNLRHGALSIHTHPCYIPLASRAAVTKTLTLAERDMLSAGLVRDHWKTIETFEARGLTAGATDNDPLFSRYPGLTPGRGSVTVSADKKIWDDQDDANERCGRLAAKEDGTYLDSNNAYHRAVIWTPELFGSYDVFDFDKEYIATSLAAASNRRDVDLSAMLYYLIRTTVRYEGGTARVTPTFLTATNAPDGATYVPEPGEVAEYSPPDSVPIPFVPPPSTIIPISGNAPSELLEFTAGVAVCILRRDFVAGVGYSTVIDKSTGLSSAVVAYGSDPFAYDSGFCANAEGVNYMAAIGTAGYAGAVNRRTLTQMFGAGATAVLCLKPAIWRNGWWIASSDDGHYAITNDNWATSTTYTTPNTYDFISISVASLDAGVVFALAEELFDDGFGINRRLRLYKSTDYGVTFASVYVTGTFGYAGTGYTGSVEVPYQRPSAQGGGNNTIASGLVVRLSYTYWFGGSGSGGIFQSADGGVTFPVTIEAASGSIGSGSVNDFWTYWADHALSTHTHDADRMIWPGLRDVGGYYARVTNDANATNYANVQLVGNSSVAFNGWPAIGTSDPAVGWWVGFDSGGGLWVSSDNGQTWLLITSDAKNYAEFRLATEQA